MRALLLFFGIFLRTLLLIKCNKLELHVNSPHDVCRLFTDGAILRKPGSCRETITCQNGLSKPHTVTCANNQIVQLAGMKCVKDSATKPDRYCAITCKKNSPKWIEDKRNCREWHECRAAKYVKSGACPLGQDFNQIKQTCIYSNGECDRIYDICDVAQTNKPFSDEINCHKYFTCDSSRKLIVKSCPTATYYEARTGNCIKKAQVNCYKHPVPDEGCGNEKLALFNRFVDDQATCRGYFYCKELNKNITSKLDWNYIPDKNPKWGQCALGEFYDAKYQICRNQNYVKCDEDRCDSRNSGLVLSETSGCQYYLVCKDGQTVGEIKCPDNKYFDPVDEICVERKISYPICA